MMPIQRRQTAKISLLSLLELPGIEIFTSSMNPALSKRSQQWWICRVSPIKLDTLISHVLYITHTHEYSTTVPYF